MRVLDSVDKEFWDQVAASSEHSTFFHTSAWARVVQETRHEYRIATRGFVLPDGARGVLPLAYSRRLGGVFKEYFSMVPWVYGGIASERMPTQEETNGIFSAELIGSRTSFSVTGNPFCSHPVPSRLVPRPNFTHILDLSSGFSAVWNGYKPAARRQIRKAEKEGVTAATAHKIRHCQEFYEAYQSALARWGQRATSKFDVQLFRSLYDLVSEGNVRLWLAGLRGGTAGGVWVLYHNTRCFYFMGAFHSSLLGTGVSNFLMNEAIRDACDRGFKTFDFLPSGTHQGVARYKESFGASKTCFDGCASGEGPALALYLRIRHVTAAVRSGLARRFRRTGASLDAAHSARCKKLAGVGPECG